MRGSLNFPIIRAFQNKNRIYYKIVGYLFSVQTEVKLLLNLDIVETVHVLHRNVDQIIAKILSNSVIERMRQEIEETLSQWSYFYCASGFLKHFIFSI